ncbi:MAG: class I SAM-dependent methyltransferase [Desulfomonilaceae bacterium]
MADHICPWWIGYLLASPLRKLFENPQKLLGPYISPGMTVLDYGCGMGFFTIPLAKMVGPSGKVIAVDIQAKMLDGVRRKAKRRQLAERITIISAGTEGQIHDASVDFVAALYVVHEIADQGTFFQKIYRIMKSGAKILIVEPRLHVEVGEFRRCLDIAESTGFLTDSDLNLPGKLRAVLSRPR